MYNNEYGMERPNMNCGCHGDKKQEQIFCKKECKCKCFKFVETECPNPCCKEMASQHYC